MTVAVVGAGVSGLVLVHALRKRGVSAVCFEARGEPGGVVKSVESNGRVLELGPQRLRMTPPVRSLVDDLGLRDEVREGKDDLPLYVYHNGGIRVVPLSIREALATDLLSWRGKARILAEPLARGIRDGETVEEFLTRKFGAEAARRYFGPLYSGLYGTPPDEMLVKHSLGRALERFGVGEDDSVLFWLVRKLLSGAETPPAFTFDDGLRRLPEALYEENSDTVRLGDRVEEIRQEADGYAVEADETVEADEVVLTVPAPTAADLLESVDTDSADALEGLRYNPIAVVHLSSDYDGDGVGVLVPGYEDVRISGVTWNNSFLGRDGVFTCYVDPRSYPGMRDATDDEIGRVAAEEFESIVGAPASPLRVHRWVPGMPAYDRSWGTLDRVNLPGGVRLCTNYVERPGVAGRISHARRLADEIADGRT